MEPHTDIKIVGQSGQISIGKRYAGKPLRAEYRADGVIVLVPVALVPESQLWTLAEPHRTRIAKGMQWAARHPPEESDLDALVRRARARRGKARGRR